MRRAIIPLMLIILSSVVYADFFVNHEILKNEISPFGTAEFEMNIINNEAYSDTYFITSSDVLWNAQTDPLTDYMSGMDVSRESMSTTKLMLKPNRNIKEGNYFVEISVVSETSGDKARDIFQITIDPKIVDYPVLIGVEVLEPTKIDPRKTSSLKIRLRNDNPIYITDAKVKVTSKWINQEASVDISPRSEKIVQFSISFDGTVPQQKDMLKVVVTRDNETIAQTQKEIEISTYIKPYKTEIVRKSGFLKTTEEITFKNIEGVEKAQEAMVKVSGFSSALTETKPKARIEEFGGETYFVWDEISLSPGESYTVTVVTNYRTFALFIFIVIIIFASYYLFRSPIVLTKRAERAKTKDGGISELKIVIEIKNRSDKMIKDVRLMDRLPKLSGISEDFGAETPEPKIRKHDTQGFVLDWENIFLEPGEERIFSYRIESKLPIVGKVELKPVVAVYGPDKKRTCSNSFSLYTD